MTAVLLVQAVVVDQAVRPIDIVVTVLLSIIGLLSVWVLQTTLDLRTDNKRLKDKVGLDTPNGLTQAHKDHAAQFKEFADDQARAWRDWERIMSRFDKRLDRLELYAKLKPYRGDDTEDDLRG